MESAQLCECGCGGPAPIATRTDATAGTVKGQPRRFILGHRKPKAQPLSERYDTVDGGHASACWRFTGSFNSGGYGTVRHRGRTASAHRAYYIEYVGAIPSGADIDHLCRNKWCVNPAHLEPVAHRENVHRGSRCVITKQDAIAIRAQYQPRVVTKRMLAAKFGVSVSTITDVIRHRTWT